MTSRRLMALFGQLKSEVDALETQDAEFEGKFGDLDSEADGGYEFTGGFVDRFSPSAPVSYTSAEASAGTWRRFGFSSAKQIEFDNEYWGEGDPAFDQSKGLFGGLYMPGDVDSLFSYDDTALSSAGTVSDAEFGTVAYTAATGSLDFTQCRPGDFLQYRFDFNITPQVQNTTVEIALIWATRDENDNVTFTFPLTGTPLFFGTGTVGKTYLNRPVITAYFASDEDVNARALPAIRADNQVLIEPLTCLTKLSR